VFYNTEPTGSHSLCKSKARLKTIAANLGRGQPLVDPFQQGKFGRCKRTLGRKSATSPGADHAGHSGPWPFYLFLLYIRYLQVVFTFVDFISRFLPSKDTPLKMWSWHPSEDCLSVPQGSMAEYGVDQPWDLPGPTDKAIGPEASTIPPTRKIPEAEWQFHKEEIRVLFLDENKTRDEVMAAMEKTYGFQARYVDRDLFAVHLTSFANSPCNSKAQYIRRLEKWGFKKYSTSEEWKSISRKIQKRNLEGKESDTFINGRLVPLKKVKKEVSRHSRPSWQWATGMLVSKHCK
jgi:hypothetical protein